MLLDGEVVREAAGPGRLSGGPRQRLALGAALASGSPILVLDEPVAELDGASAAAAPGLWQDAADRGCIVVLATTDPALLPRAPL